MSFEDFSDKYSGCDFDTYLRAFSRIEISGFNDYIGNKLLYVADTKNFEFLAPAITLQLECFGVVRFMFR